MEDVLELDQSITKCPNQFFTTMVPLNVVRDFITNRAKKIKVLEFFKQNKISKRSSKDRKSHSVLFLQYELTCGPR